MKLEHSSSDKECQQDVCAGQDSQVASAVMADKIEWCGGEYDVADLKAALAMLLPPGTPQDQLLAQEYSDPWAPDTWNLLGPPAQSLLKNLAQATFNLHVSVKTLSRRTRMHACALLSKQSAFSGSDICVQGSVGSCMPDCMLWLCPWDPAGRAW